MVFMLLMLYSCSVKKKVIEEGSRKEDSTMHKDSTSITTSVSKLTSESFRDYMIEFVGKGDIIIFDTSMAVDTGGGFYAPVKAHIKTESTANVKGNEEENETIENIETRHDSLSVSASNHEEENNIRKENKSTTNSMAVFFNGIVIGILLLLLGIVFYKIKRE